MYNSSRLVGSRIVPIAAPAQPNIARQTRTGQQVYRGMDRLYWDDAYAIALALIERHAGIDPLAVDWETLHRWVIELPDFADDPTLEHLGWLRDIQKEWYEEVSG